MKKDYLEEEVDIELFLDNKRYKEDVFVSINGDNCLIKRGEPVKIKRKFALLLDSAHAQDIKARSL